jgi:hypothetical protein
MPNALTKIHKRAKQLKKKHPHAKWISLIKQAGKDYRAGKLGSAVKRHAVKKVRKSKKVHRVHHRNVVRHAAPVSNVGIKEQAKQHLAKALLDYDLANTVKATKEAQKRKNKWRKVVRSLS